jgi:hypothetical protein
MEKIIWTDRVNNEVLQTAKEDGKRPAYNKTKEG